jgi:hypothetical protein
VLVVIARRAEALRGRRPRTCTETSCAGTGRAWVCPLSALSSGTPWEVLGRTPRMYEPRQSDGCIVPGKSPNKPGLTTGAEGTEGRRPAKGKMLQSSMPRTQSRARHERDTGAPTMNRASRNRHDESLTPAARAGCGNSARPDPCGGRSAMTVPTATRSHLVASQLKR